MTLDPHGFELEEEDMAYWAYEYAYNKTGASTSPPCATTSIPTIGLFNGPGFHPEILLNGRPHYRRERERRDLRPALRHRLGTRRSIHTAFQELLGIKRAAYALLTGKAIDAQQALDWGGQPGGGARPSDRRAYEIADHIMTQPRTTAG